MLNGWKRDQNNRRRVIVLLLIFVKRLEYQEKVWFTGMPYSARNFKNVNDMRSPPSLFITSRSYNDLLNFVNSTALLAGNEKKNYNKILQEKMYVKGKGENSSRSGVNLSLLFRQQPYWSAATRRQRRGALPQPQRSGPPDAAPGGWHHHGLVQNFT